MEGGLRLETGGWRLEGHRAGRRGGSTGGGPGNRGRAHGEGVAALYG